MSAAMVAAFGQWEFTYGAGLGGAWLCCAATGRLADLWYVTVGAVAVCLTRSAAAAHSVAAATAVLPTIRAASAAYRRLQNLHTQHP